MDLSTNYLGLKLPHPLMPGASPLVGNLDTVRRLEDAGAAAIVLHSLFEEQIISEQFREEQDVEVPEETFAEAITYHPHRNEYRASGSEDYLERVRKIKEIVSVPVIASLNGVSLGAWIEYAAKCAQAGADALELNVYFMATDIEESSETIEHRVVEVVKAVKGSVTIPVAIKLSPFFSSLPSLAKRIEEAGADGILLFNRFYQPDIDVEKLEGVPKLRLSDSSELLLRLRWIAILSGKVDLSLGATGGVHTAIDAIKMVMAGAHGVQMVSALLRNGPNYLRQVLVEMTSWMEQHDYESIDQMRGSMSLLNCPDPAAFTRENYMRILQGGTKYV